MIHLILLPLTLMASNPPFAFAHAVNPTEWKVFAFAFLGMRGSSSLAMALLNARNDTLKSLGRSRTPSTIVVDLPAPATATSMRLSPESWRCLKKSTWCGDQSNSFGME